MDRHLSTAKLSLFWRIALVAVALVAVISRVGIAANHTDYKSIDAASYERIADAIVADGTFGREPRDFRWPPGAPAMFAAARAITPDSSVELNQNAPYYAQAAVSIATILLIFLIARQLLGTRFGIVAAALLAVYLPHLWASGELLSETLGAFFLSLTVWAAMTMGRALDGHGKDPSRVAVSTIWLWAGAAGAATAGLILTRADYIFALVPLTALVFWLAKSTAGLSTAAVYLLAALIPIGAWSGYATSKSSQPVLVTSGGGAALFVGTYLPGNGTTAGMKKALYGEVIKAHPKWKGRPYFVLPAREYLGLVMARHRQDSRDKALRKESIRNIKHLVKNPWPASKMAASKVSRTWFRYARGGSRPTSVVVTLMHSLLVVSSLFAAIFALLRFRRRLTFAAKAAVIAGLGLIAYQTVIHAIFVAQGRYNLPLMPVVIALGVWGWVTLAQGRSVNSTTTLPAAASAKGGWLSAT